MSKSIKLTEHQWLTIYHDIARNYPHSVLLIREKMKSVLGFTSRTHREWISEGFINGRDAGRYEENIYLDFYSEPKRTMFLLKYSEYLDSRD